MPLLFSLGLWPDGSDGTDINAVCRTNDKSLLVTGDDFGKVHLFTYPCSQFRVGPATALRKIYASAAFRKRLSCEEEHNRKLVTLVHLAPCSF